METFKGMCVPICTPFVEGGEAVDEGALKAHIDWLIENGVHIILAGGGTGEFAYLRPAELRRVSEVAAKHVARRAHVFAQTSAINTADVIANRPSARHHLHARLRFVPVTSSFPQIFPKGPARILCPKNAPTL